LHSRIEGRQASVSCLEAMYLSAKSYYLILNIGQVSMFKHMHTHKPLSFNVSGTYFQIVARGTENPQAAKQVFDLSVYQCAVSKLAW